MAKQIVPQLRDAGKVTRGWLGVVVQPMSEELAQSFDLDRSRGALVSDVVKDSPAAHAGLQRGDVILSFDGQAIDERNDLPKVVANTSVGKTVKVVVFRDGKEKELKVAVGKLTEDDEPDISPATVSGVITSYSIHYTKLYELQPGTGQPRRFAAEAAPTGRLADGVSR